MDRKGSIAIFDYEVTQQGHYLMQDRVITDENIDSIISYHVHHKKFDKESLRCVLIYLLAEKYHILDNIYDHDENVTDYELGFNQFEAMVMPIIWHNYHDHKDYKILQLIYSEDNQEIYRYHLATFIETQYTNKLWKLSIYSWDYSFTKFIYAQAIKKLYKTGASNSLLKAFSPNERLIRKFMLLDQESEYFKYISKKLDTLSKLKV